MLRGVERSASFTKHYWLDSRYEVYHPVEILQLDEDGCRCEVKLRVTKGIFRYLPKEIMWVDRECVDLYEFSPNGTRTKRANYLKSIHPYKYTFKVDYWVGFQNYGTVIDNSTDPTVNILLFIIGH